MLKKLKQKKGKENMEKNKEKIIIGTDGRRKKENKKGKQRLR